MKAVHRTASELVRDGLGEVSPEGHREDREEQNHGPGQLESVHVCRAT